MTILNLCHGAACPAIALVPQQDVWKTDEILAAARRAVDRAEAGRILEHVLLTHAREVRFRVAQVLAEVAPAAAASAAGQIRGFLSGRRGDPLRGAATGQPSEAEALAYQVLLAVLGTPARDLDALVAAAADSAFLYVAAAYGMLGLRQGRTAADRLAAIARAGGHHAARIYQPMLLLGPQYHRLLDEVLTEIVDAGTPLHSMIGSLDVRAAGFQELAAGLALRSLPLGPDYAIRRRHHRETDTVSQVLACGEHFLPLTLAALTAVASTAALPADQRWHAAHRAADLDADSFGRIAEMLRCLGVADPTEGPLPPELDEEQRAAIASRVAQAWDRIRAQLRTRHPDFAIHFGPGATAAEIAALEAELGFALPADFAASLALHREVRFDGLVHGLCPHLDIGRLAEARASGLDWEDGVQRDPRIRGDYGWRPGWVPLDCRDSDFDVLDLDPAPAGHYGQVVRISHDSRPSVHAESWLAMLEHVADLLQADRLVADSSDRQVLWLREGV